MAASTDTETQWYENVEEGTFHEVATGSDTEKRLRKETFQSDPDDENSLEQRYRKVTERRATSSPEDQPGYVVPSAPAEPTVVQIKSQAQVDDDEVERRVAARLEQERAAQAAALAETTPQTPTADTKDGPLVGEPGAAKQADVEVKLGGAAPGGVKPSATAQSVAKGK